MIEPRIVTTSRPIAMLPYASRASVVTVEPSRAGVAVNGPLSGYPSSATAAPRCPSAIGSGRPLAVHANDGDVVPTVEGHDGARMKGAVAAIDPQIRDAGDDVRIRDDEPGRADPARALDAEAAGVAGHAHDAVAGEHHRGRA